MHAWEAIQNSLDYIEDHLSEDIPIETLADVAALSPYYFQRLFGRLVKKPVNEYVKLRRLAKATEALKKKGNRILEIALDCGFSGHTNFTRAFKDAYGITPEEYREFPVILNQFIKPDLKLNYIMVDEDVPLIVDGMVVEVNRKILDESYTFVGILGEVPDTELAGGRNTGVATMGGIWDDFHRQKGNIPYLLPGGRESGVLYKGDAREGCCTYLAGAETSGNAGAEGCSSFTLPIGEYVVCCIEAENFSELIGSAVYKTSSFMRGWMKNHDLVCGDFIAEMYYGHDPDTRYMELWLPIRPLDRSCKPAGMKPWVKTDGAHRPPLETIGSYVNSPLWNQLCEYVETEYQCSPVLEYSRCSMQFGWNVKYKKAGRTLCTLYPLEGSFITLIVIGEREKTETEMALPFFSEYVQGLFRDTKTSMNQKWLMINVTDDSVLEDVKKCISIRRGIKRKKK